MKGIRFSPDFETFHEEFCIIFCCHIRKAAAFACSKKSEHFERMGVASQYVTRMKRSRRKQNGESLENQRLRFGKTGGLKR